MGDVPEVVVVGAASRDLVDDDPRGWRLGGGVSYAALTLARLGLRVGALIGADRLAAESRELHVLRDAGVDVAVARLDRGPVFINTETPNGRIQHAPQVSEPVLPSALPRGVGERRRVAVRTGRRRAAGRLGRRPSPRRARRRSAGRACSGCSSPVSRSCSIRPARRRSSRAPDLVGVGSDDVDPSTPGSRAPGASCARAPRCC